AASERIARSAGLVSRLCRSNFPGFFGTDLRLGWLLWLLGGTAGLPSSARFGGSLGGQIILSTRRLGLIDSSNHLSNAGRFTGLFRWVQNAADRRRQINRCLVRFQLTDRLIDGDVVAPFLKPLGYDRFSNRFA